MLKRILPLIIGLVLILVAEIGQMVNSLFIREWFYTIVWWGYILSVDGIIYLVRKNSLIINRPRSFLLMLPWSITIWLVFELYNIRLQNWAYANVTPVLIERWLGYALSFATVLPAIFETVTLLEIIFRQWLERIPPLKFTISPKAWRVIFWGGIILLIIPLLLPQYLFPLVWVSFILILEPLIHRQGGSASLTALSVPKGGISLIARGNLRKVIILFAAGLACGILWEFWNWQARTRWIYTIPYFNFGKIFEMPILGYLGFLPFAWECYIMYQFVVLNGYSRPLGEETGINLIKLSPPRKYVIISYIFLIVFMLSMFALMDMVTVRSVLP